MTASVANNRYDPSYRIHSFQGRELYRKSIDTLVRFRWRPRPPVQLSEQKQKEIRRNLKHTSQRFEEEDRREQQKLSKELLEKRHEITKEFNALRESHLAMYEQEKKDRLRLRGKSHSKHETCSGGVDADQVSSDTIEEKVTVVVSTEKTEIKEKDDD